MPKVEEIEVAIGDFLRCKDDHKEGRVIAIGADAITLDLFIGGERVLAFDEVTWNKWDPKVKGDPVSIEELANQLATLTTTVDELVLGALMDLSSLTDKLMLPDV